MESLSVFVSADDRDILLGDDWFKQISEALSSSSILLLLCSKSSIVRPWISFEAGWGWGKSASLIPVCYNGVSPDTLPPPFDKRQGISLEEVDGLENLIRGIALRRERYKIPPLDFNSLSVQLQQILSTIKSPSTAFVEQGQQSQVEHKTEKEKILLVLEKTDKRLTDSMIENLSGVSRSLTKILLSRLDAEGLVWTGYMMNGPNTYGITDDGREHLLKNGLL